VLYDPFRRLPEIPKISLIVVSLFRPVPELNARG
jgi:hypothetical protein